MKVLRGESNLVDGKWIHRDVTEEEYNHYLSKLADGRATMLVIQKERNKNIVPCSPHGRSCDTSGKSEDLEIFRFEMKNEYYTNKWYVGAFTVCRKCGYTWQYDANI